MDTILETEIRSQPEVIGRLIECELPHVEQIIADLPPFDYVLIAARGSSDHAALYAKYAWAVFGGYPVALAAPSLHTLYNRPPHLGRALVVGISQSGQSPDIVAVLEDARRQQRPTIAITNDSTSPLAKAAGHVVELHAGRERSVAATKTYTAQLAVIAMFASVWSGERARQDELHALPDALAATLAGTTEIAHYAQRLRSMESVAVVGRGFNYATSFELALKLKELTYVMAQPYSSADFRHGPIATVDAGSPIILVIPTGQARPDMLDLAGELQKRGAELIVISDAADALALARLPLPFGSTLPEWLSPLCAIVPGQQLALHLALAKGLNPDLPRGLAKVTRTR